MDTLIHTPHQSQLFTRSIQINQAEPPLLLMMRLDGNDSKYPSTDYSTRVILITQAIIYICLRWNFLTSNSQQLE
ncbi:hypothetical protein FGO68_gene12541 [Halteria grandinella]|uniref:Uncharacterized protein n=1 Tax=Halteria grandinella TaxID=5974 RepID=A0A8J8NT80_HALGN|nr:hypothetical protein FGO68_gene12541 [Halteria grandinella]